VTDSAAETRHLPYKGRRPAAVLHVGGTVSHPVLNSQREPAFCNVAHHVVTARAARAAGGRGLSAVRVASVVSSGLWVWPRWSVSRRWVSSAAEAGLASALRCRAPAR
jgi:hypothetical protein